MTDAIRRERLL